MTRSTHNRSEAEILFVGLAEVHDSASQQWSQPKFFPPTNPYTFPTHPDRTEASHWLRWQQLQVTVVVSLGSRRLHKLTGHCETTKAESVNLLFPGFRSPARAISVH